MAAKNPHAVALGRLGGSQTSEAKRKASAENGKKGGRPRKDLAAMMAEGLNTQRNGKKGGRHLASCLFDGGRWFCAADCRHHVIVDVDAERALSVPRDQQKPAKGRTNQKLT